MSSFIPSNLISRIRYQLRRQGLKATIGRVMEYARMKAYLDETHIWYELPLGTERPRAALAPELELIRSSESELPLLDGLPGVGQVEAKLRMESNADLWLVVDGRQPAFACWIFHGSTPVVAARGGRLALPPEIACLEDSVTSADYRGRGIAPAAWSGIADTLELTGVRSIITKIAESNTPSRRAIVKSGFHEIATMHFQRLGPRQRVTIQSGTGMAADWLARQLPR